MWREGEIGGGTAVTDDDDDEEEEEEEEKEDAPPAAAAVSELEALRRWPRVAALVLLDGCDVRKCLA